MSKRTNTCQIDHSPEREAPTAPAPGRVSGVAGYSLLGAMRRANGDGPRTADQRVTDVPEVWRRIRAAVAQEVAETDRDDAQADLWLALAVEARGETDGHTDAPRRERVRMAYLRLQARDWERTRGRRRAELRDELSAETAATPLHAVELAGSPETAAPEWSPAAARHGARQLCYLLNLSAGGKIETALYTYLRGSTPLAEVASETGHTEGGLRVALSHGRALIRAAYPDPRALLAALLLLDPPALPAGKPRKGAWRAAALLNSPHIPADAGERARADAIPSEVRYGHTAPTRLPISAARRLHLARAARRTSYSDHRVRLAARHAGNGRTANR